LSGKKYKVKTGDCISNISAQAGHFWETIWNDPANAKLKQKRSNPNCLLAGDVVTVPSLRDKTEACATDQQHRFRRKGVPTKLAMRLLDGDTPRANEDYRFQIDGKTIEGVTDGDGKLEEVVPCRAKSATLFVGEDEFELALGYLDPITEMSGVQGRLTNLGYDCGKINGKLDSETREALLSFQKANGLNETGEADSATVDKLEQLHGS
jgi:hypothetical protein